MTTFTSSQLGTLLWIVIWNMCFCVKKSCKTETFTNPANQEKLHYDQEELQACQKGTVSQNILLQTDQRTFRTPLIIQHVFGAPRYL